jgi:hypothetical protein
MVKVIFSMAHGKSLRVIGQSLETARIEEFELEKDGHDYLVKGSGLSAAGEWILRNATSENFLTAGRRPSDIDLFRFTPTDISRLDSQWQKQRKNGSSLRTLVSSRLAQLMRSLGDHLDRAGANTFHVVWSAGSVFVDYQAGEQCDSRTFTTGKLEELGLHNRFHRASPSSSTRPPIRPGPLLR